MFAFGKPNFRLSGQKLFLDFKNPFKIVASAEPEPRTRTSSVRDTLREGEATIAQNPNFEKWRRERDSNPRAAYTTNTLAGCPFQPLRHLSNLLDN